MQNKGFTLIELLVAITIVAIMSTLGFMGIKGQIKKAKATRAISAVKETSKALELYYTKNDEYPTDLNGSDPDSPDFKKYFQNGKVPAGVVYDGNSTGYCLYVDADYVKLVDDSKTPPEPFVKNVTLNCTGCSSQAMTTGNPNDNFCLVNAQ